MSDPSSTFGQRKLLGNRACAEARKLLDAFLAAVREMTELSAQQVEATLTGDLDFQRFDILLHYAQEKKDNAKYNYLLHVESHGCLPDFTMPDL
jgi:hypothetical protein